MLCSDLTRRVREVYGGDAEIETLDMHLPEVARRALSLGIRQVPAALIDGRLAGEGDYESREEAGGPGPAGTSSLDPGDQVLARSGRYAGQVGEVEGVFHHDVAGRRREIVWVRFKDRTVEGFAATSLLKKGGKK